MLTNVRNYALFTINSKHPSSCLIVILELLIPFISDKLPSLNNFEFMFDSVCVMVLDPENCHSKTSTIFSANK